MLRLCGLGLIWLTLCLAVPAQKKNVPPVCFREDALPLIEQQLDQAWAAEASVERITVLLRGAGLLWPYRQDKARETFAKAFEWAVQRYAEKGREITRSGKFETTQLPDQRYRVLSAIAQRDSAWAYQLARQMLDDEAQTAGNATDKKPQTENETSDNLLNAARELQATDPQAALRLARLSLRYPPGVYLPMFLYHLAEKDSAAADRFFQEAVAAYGDKPMTQFLYLSAYPFGLDKAVGEMPSWTNYLVPAGYTPQPATTRLFVQTLVQRAQQAAENPAAASAGGRVPDTAQMWLALTRLETNIAQSLPDLAIPAQQAKNLLYAAMTEKTQQQSANIRADEQRRQQPPKSFTEQVADAEAQSKPEVREQRLAMAVMFGSRDVPLEQVVAAAEKIEDEKLRAGVLGWFYFERARNAIKDKKPDLAAQLAARVTELDQRAYLNALIVQELLKEPTAAPQARELLDEVIALAQKAPDTLTKGRVLLALAFFYDRFDPARAMSLLDDAVKCINRLEKPDFSQTALRRKIEGRTFASYSSFNISGFSPQETFRALGQRDFNGVLYQAGNFTDKPLRTLTTLAVLEGCLAHTKQQPKPGRKN